MEPDIDEEDIKVYRDKDGKRRIEGWTDGELIRLGRDVTDRSMCLSFRLDNWKSVESKLRYEDLPSTARFSGYEGIQQKYVIYSHSMNRAGVIHDDSVILLLGDEGYPIYNIRSLALEKRNEFEAEEHARAFITSTDHFSFAKEVEVERLSERGLSSTVNITVYRENYSKVNLRVLDELREIEYIMDISVLYEQDVEAMCYDFSLDTEQFVDNLEDQKISSETDSEE